MDRTVQLEIDSQTNVANLWLNRPDGANGVTVELSHDLAAAVETLRGSSVRCILLRGRGRMFCGGGDVKGFASDPGRIVADVVDAWHPAVAALLGLDLPVVAAVHGSAAGAGLGLVAAADLVYAARSAKFVLAYSAIALSPDGSSSWFLPRLVGAHRAMELALLNRVLSAEEAHAWGIVNSVMDDDVLFAEAEAVATKIAAGPTKAFAAARRLIHGAWDHTLAEQLDHEAAELKANAASSDGREGITAFVERRPPRFEGR